MAASIYATPPPDLSSEDTALSDASNSSLNERNNNDNNRRRVSSTQSAGDSNESATAAPTSKSAESSVGVGVVADASVHEHQQQQQQPYHQTSSNMGSNKNSLTDSNDAESSTLAAAAGATDAAVAPAATTQNATATIAAVAAAANAAMQLQLLEAISDAAKKRRKQHTPLRLDALNSSLEEGCEGLTGGDETALEGTEAGNATAMVSGGGAEEVTIDYEQKLSKIFLPHSMEQLKETFQMLQQQQQQQQQQLSKNISTATEGGEGSGEAASARGRAAATNEDEHVAQVLRQEPRKLDAESMESPYRTYCKECGENFETEFKLGIHMLTEHAADDAAADSGRRADQGKDQLTPYEILASVKVKMEHPDSDSRSPLTSPSSMQQQQQQQHQQQHQLQQHSLPNGKDQWQNIMAGSGKGGLNFPHFSPEAAAAAALSASGYLPLLGGMPGFASGVDGLNRTPLRIFNPEAYCELCNKEFCNKYFLKTHKANKHGIYESATGGAPSETTVSQSGNTMNQMFQLQMLQQQQKQDMSQSSVEPQARQQPLQQMPLQPSQHQITPSAPPPIFCEICSKRFTNVFAMRRHRAKAHEQRSSPSDQLSKSAEASAQKAEKADAAAKIFQMPEGFREDYTLEQEEVSFTPQPRKLSLQSQQQAREANFAHDKLRRLGVLQPEAFCELCCKEYCNKYFLRTHKWKRHGIFVPPDDAKEEFLGGHKLQSAWPFINMPSTPLNLMMATADPSAVAAQRMLVAANAATKHNELEETQQAKRIKLEAPDDYDESQAGKREIQELKTDESQGMDGDRRQQSVSPEPPLQDSAFNLSTGSPEASVGLQNLQKLQSMIQQLSDLSGKRPVACQLCGKELENQYSLHAHMMTEHATAPDKDSSNNFVLQQQQQQQQQQALKLSPSNSSPSAGITPNASDLRCVQCDRDFSSALEFKQHIAEVHLLPSSPIRDGFVTPERPTNPAAGAGTRPPYTLTPTSSYCEICNKELCNKYFMKTHMQRMHGIEIENGAQIGGVVCNICNKELCSKYFLRVHKHNTHGIVEEGSPLPQQRQNGLAFDQQQQQQQQQQQPLMDPELARGMTISPFGTNDPNRMEASDARFVPQNYNESCQLCTRRFRHPKWLRAHLLSDHGAAGVEKLRELELQYGAFSKPASPTLKIPNGTAAAAATNLMAASPVNVAQALQSLNSQHVLGSLPKAAFGAGMFGAVAEQALHSARFKEYQCSMCPFSTPYYAFFFIHERSHSIMNTTGGGGGGGGSPTGQQENQQQQVTTSREQEVTTPPSTKLPLKTSHEPNSMEATDLSKHSTAIPFSTPVTEGSNARRARSAATSPILSPSNRQNVVNRTAQLSGKAACYAVPQHSGENEPEMQAFILEQPNTGTDEGECEPNRFMPAIIYLPVRERLSEPLTVSFKLTPA